MVAGRERGIRPRRRRPSRISARDQRGFAGLRRGAVRLQHRHSGTGLRWTMTPATPQFDDGLDLPPILDRRPKKPEAAEPPLPFTRMLQAPTPQAPVPAVSGGSSLIH